MSELRLRERMKVPTYDDESYATTGRVLIDHERCNGCGICVQICPGKALYLSEEGEEKKAYLEKEFPQCMSCNDCAAICERDAIAVSVVYDFGFYYMPLFKGGLESPRTF